MIVPPRLWANAVKGLGENSSDRPWLASCAGGKNKKLYPFLCIPSEMRGVPSQVSNLCWSVFALKWDITSLEGMASNGDNRPTQGPRVRNVWSCYWLSNRRAKTTHITSQSWAAAGAPRRWASFVAAEASAQVLLLIPKLCPGGQRQRLTVNNSTLLV